MLTVTYALVALSIEHKRVNGALVAAQQEIRHAKRCGMDLDAPMLESMLSRLLNLDTACAERNFELFVLPALRSVSVEAERMLNELDALCTRARIQLRQAQGKLREARQRAQCASAEILGSLDTYCQLALERTRFEEAQILPLAQRLISSDEWFDIAAKFISHDSERQGRRNYGRHLVDNITAMAVAAQTGNNVATTNAQAPV